MYKTNQNDYLDPTTVELYYSVPGTGPKFKNRIFSFKHVEVPLFGCGPLGKPIIECDNFLNLDLLDGVEEEFNSNLHLAKHRLHHMVPFGLVPASLNEEKCLDSYLLNLDKYDPGLTYSPYIQHMTHYHELKNYMLNRYGLIQPWKNVIHLKQLKGFFEKNSSAVWNDVACYFPKLIKLINSLPFKTVGYVMIMRSKENSRLPIHRDIYPRNHNAHHINISIDKKPRQFFVYDISTNEKIYKQSDCLSYFFNESDLHGCDYSFIEHLTLRVDGEFQDWFAEQIGLINGVTFDWGYDKPQDFFLKTQQIPVIEGTDI